MEDAKSISLADFGSRLAQERPEFFRTASGQFPSFISTLRAHLRAFLRSRWVPLLSRDWQGLRGSSRLKQVGFHWGKNLSGVRSSETYRRLTGVLLGVVLESKSVEA